MATRQWRQAAQLAAGWVAGTWLLWRMPAPGEIEPGSLHDARGAPAPTVSVVIPARNEEHSLPRLLASLASQTHAPDQVLVVDDHSSDGTAAVARATGATVVAGTPPPDGWTGKTWVCHQGAALATGSLLLFIDADVELAPDAIARLLAEHAALGRPARGLVSVQPAHRTERPYERLSALCNVVSLMGTGAFTPVRRACRTSAVAFGPCLLIDRATYAQVGGHSHPDVRRLVTEDIGLAVQVRRVGLPVVVRAGRRVVAFRMYPDGLQQLVEGWTKMLATGATRTSPVAAAGTALWVTGALLAAAGGARSALRLLSGRSPRGRDAAAAAVYAAYAGQVAWMARRAGAFGRGTGALFPVPLAAFVVLFARSVDTVLIRRKVMWRGRLVPDQNKRP